MPSIKTAPKHLRPYQFHGLDLDHRDGHDQAVTDCPFCGKEGKFYVAVENGLWSCKVCGTGTNRGGGNVFTFLRLLWETSYKQTKEADYRKLAADRGLLNWQTLAGWGLCRSFVSGAWLVPGYNHEGNLTQLYRYARNPETKKMFLLGTPDAPAALFGAAQQGHLKMYDPKKPEVHVCEGPWDGMAWAEALSVTGTEGGEYKLTAGEGLLGKVNVMAVPGCQTFSEHWCPLFAGKVVSLLYDNDHPVKNEGANKTTPPAGYAGMRRAAGVMTSHPPGPITVHYLKWAGDFVDAVDHNPQLPAGYDLRDHLGMSASAAGRVSQAKFILNSLKPIPDDWGFGRKADGTGSGELEPVECRDWRALQMSWRRAMKWTDGLDRALSVMLAAIVSTETIGEQLWCKVMGPPSCLDGDTPIYDPIDGTTKSVAERWREGKRFFVWTKGIDGAAGIAQALPPTRYTPTEMYELTFRSGRRFRVTGGHQIWNGSAYVAVHTIARELPLSDVYPLPTISDTDLSIQTQGVLRSMRKVVNSLCDCRAYPCSCDGPLRTGSAVAPSTPPFSSGVPAYNRGSPDDRRADEYGCTHLRQPGDPPSKPRSPRPGEARTAESQSSSYGGGALSFSYWSASRGSTEPSSPLPGTSPLGGPFAPGASGAGTPLLAPLRLYTPSTERNRPDELLRPDYSLRYTTEHNGQLSPGSTGALPQVEVSPRLLEDTFGSSVSRPEELRNTPLGFYRTDTSRLPSDASPESTQQSLEHLVLKGKFTVDPLTLSETDEIVKVEFVGVDNYYDFAVPETGNYWCKGLFHHNCGKSTLCEALSVAKKYVKALSTLRGFHSGYKSDKEGAEDHSLIPQVMGKTLVLKDGDTLLQLPNLSQVLSEARDLFDGTSRAHYRHGLNRAYDRVRMTWILCGTGSLRFLDSSELGARFIDCVIMDGIDPEFEREVNRRVAFRALRNVKILSNGAPETYADVDMVRAKQLTGGYVEYLRQNADRLLNSVEMGEAEVGRVIAMGEFVAMMRARPSLKQDEIAEREFSSRLVEQYVRLAVCMAAVLNRRTIDTEVMSRVRSVALDTARGRAFDLCRELFKLGPTGGETGALSNAIHETDDKKTGHLLKYLKRIGVVTRYIPMDHGVKGRGRWVLSDRLVRLYREVAV